MKGGSSSDDLESKRKPLDRAVEVEELTSVSLKMIIKDVHTQMALASNSADFWPCQLRRLDRTLAAKRSETEELRSAYALAEQRRLLREYSSSTRHTATERMLREKQAVGVEQKRKRLRLLLEKACETGDLLLQTLEPLANWSHQLETALTEIAISKDGYAADGLRVGQAHPLEVIKGPDELNINKVSDLVRSLTGSRAAAVNLTPANSDTH